MKPYASYKPSGVPWLGDVPSHWRVMPIRYLSRGVKTGGTPSQEAFVDELSEGAIPWYAPADLRNLYLTDSSRIVATEFSSDVDVFDVGTIALVGIGDVGRVAMLSVEGTGNQQLNFIRPVEGVVSKYLTYAFMAGQEFVRSRANVTLIPILNQESTKRLPFVVPDLDEQQAIVDYLDVETARIDTLIHEKDELIGLLKEARSSTIIEAVSRGVYPSAPLKSSGLHFLGNVPRHWEKFKVAHAFGTSSGTTPPTDEPEWYEGDVPWVQSSELRENVVFSTEKKVTVEAVQKFSALKLYPVGTLLLAMYGATIGRVGLLGVPATTNQACCALRPLGEISTQFFCWWLQAYRDEIVARGYGGGQPNISATLISGMYFFAPPPDEQHAIVAYLDAETAKIDDLIAHTHEEITLLKELRAATIADAVLGRVDVRTAPKQ